MSDLKTHFYGPGVPAKGKISQEYPLGSTVSGKNTAVCSGSCMGGFAGMVFLPEPDPQLSRGQHTLLRNLKHEFSAPVKALPMLKAVHMQRVIPTSTCNTARSCTCTLLHITKKRFWRPHSLNLFLLSSKGKAGRSVQAARAMPLSS